MTEHDYRFDSSIRVRYDPAQHTIAIATESEGRHPDEWTMPLSEFIRRLGIPTADVIKALNAQ